MLLSRFPVSASNPVPQQSNRDELILLIWSDLSFPTHITHMFPGYAEYKNEQYAAALPKLQRVAEAGNAEAQSMVGCLYQIGFGQVEIDEAAAISWYTRASEQGHGLASSNLAGMRFIEGKLEESNRLYQLALDQGFPHGRAPRPLNDSSA